MKFLKFWCFLSIQFCCGYSNKCKNAANHWLTRGNYIEKEYGLSSVECDKFTLESKIKTYMAVRILNSSLNPENDTLLIYTPYYHGGLRFQEHKIDLTETYNSYNLYKVFIYFVYERKIGSTKNRTATVRFSIRYLNNDNKKQSKDDSSINPVGIVIGIFVILAVCCGGGAYYKVKGDTIYVYK